MQKKNDNFLEKIVKKDYNNELEKVLEKKYFDENVKSLLLNILYKIEGAYKDYKRVKVNVETKEEFVENIINSIQKNCDEIKLVKPYSEESKIIGNKTFLVEKEKKRIICYHMEKKLLYCIAKIAKNEKIIKDKYFLINKTLSNLINTGNNISIVEPLRDFNGYSWTSIPKEIESVEHNLIYQNLIILLGNEFLNKWVYNKEVLIDYMELFEYEMEEKYGNKNAKEFIELLKKISILLEIKFSQKSKEELQETKDKIEKRLKEVENNQQFIEKITNQKRKITEEIKRIDETINNKNMLQEEYKIRNETLPLEEKIFSIRVLSKIMAKEREEKIEQIEKLNELLNPQRFIKYKKELESREKYLKLLETEDLQKDIISLKRQIQKVFLKCFETKIEKAESKQELVKLIYEFRYYCMLPYDYEKPVKEAKELAKEIEKTGKKLIERAHKLKVIEKFSKQEEIDYKLLKNIFLVRSINLEEISIKLCKEKDRLFIQVFDDKAFENKEELQDVSNVNKRDLLIRFNKKVKVLKN